MSTLWNYSKGEWNKRNLELFHGDTCIYKDKEADVEVKFIVDADPDQNDLNRLAGLQDALAKRVLYVQQKSDQLKEKSAILLDYRAKIHKICRNTQVSNVLQQKLAQVTAQKLNALYPTVEEVHEVPHHKAIVTEPQTQDYHPFNASNVETVLPVPPQQEWERQRCLALGQIWEENSANLNEQQKHVFQECSQLYLQNNFVESFNKMQQSVPQVQVAPYLQS